MAGNKESRPVDGRNSISPAGMVDGITGALGL